MKQNLSVEEAAKAVGMDETKALGEVLLGEITILYKESIVHACMSGASLDENRLKEDMEEITRHEVAIKKYINKLTGGNHDTKGKDGEYKKESK